MKTMKWLLRREFWEHKGALMWAPVVVGGLILLFFGSIILYGMSMGEFNGHITVDGKMADISMMFANLTAEKKDEIASVVANLYMSASVPLFLMLAVIVFFYCLGAMFEERRDRSILFWKSLPVSDTQTVLSKVITAALVAPLITITVGTFISLLLLMLVGVMFAFHGVNMFGLVLSNADFYLLPLRLIGLLPVYILWALPTIGWLMMVSAWAKSKVFLWAVGTPIIAIIVVKWANYLTGAGINIDWFVQNVISRGLVGLVPGVWLPLANVNVHNMVDGNNTAVMSEVFTHSWMTLGTPAAWFGAAAGAAMIFAAIRLRRWKDEG